MGRVRRELKIMGTGPVLLLLSTGAVLALLSALGGELLYLSVMGFEVVFPLLTAIAVGEWGRIRSDDNFQAIAAQSRSLFRWILCRFAASFGEAAAAAFLAMLLVSSLRREMGVWEMALLYLPTAFFLSTVSVLVGACCSREHVATLSCGMMGLSALLCRGLLRIPGVAYLYPFVRYAVGPDGIWLANKAFLSAAGLLLWGVVFRICRKRG